MSRLLSTEIARWPLPNQRIATLLKYSVALGAAAAATALRLALDELIGPEPHPYLTLYFAAAIVAWWAGLGPALVTLGLGLLGCLWVVVPPRDSLALRGLEDLLEILVCLLVSVSLISLSVLRRISLTARQQAEKAREQITRAHDRLRMILDSISDAFASLNREWHYTYANRAAGLLFRRGPKDLVGKNFWQEWPHARRLPCADELRRAVAENVTVQFEAFWPEPLNAWLEVRGYPSAEGLSLFFTDITSRREAEQMLKEAKDVLARTNHDLERLVKERTEKLIEALNELQMVSYSMVHDMRSPLRAISSYAVLVEREITAGRHSRAKELCRRTAEGAERLDKLIVNSLNYTKMVHGELPLEPIDLSALINEIIQSYPNLQSHADRIEVDPLPHVLGNKAALTQCFANLLDNGLKFVADGAQPRLRVWAEPRGSLARVWIQDHGIGISEEDLGRIFNLFERASTKFVGTGIGLAIVRKSARRMGGEVGVESALGKGARFWIDLKTASADADQPMAPSQEV